MGKVGTDLKRPRGLSEEEKEVYKLGKEVVRAENKVAEQEMGYKFREGGEASEKQRGLDYFSAGLNASARIGCLCEEGYTNAYTNTDSNTNAYTNT